MDNETYVVGKGRMNGEGQDGGREAHTVTAADLGEKDDARGLIYAFQPEPEGQCYHHPPGGRLQPGSCALILVRSTLQRPPDNQLASKGKAARAQRACTPGQPGGEGP